MTPVRGGAVRVYEEQHWQAIGDGSHDSHVSHVGHHPDADWRPAQNPFP